jgi:diaminohydroxyphosphoribosylaminopyrimidine deaminase/5-amino-6-(5-phosphoribosylamino)uracil reductase
MSVLVSVKVSVSQRYMLLALKLAKRGIGSVEPNPAVGCVIVKDNKIIGTGWHKKFGGPHAEINALENCKRLDANPQGATMYVTLEPCCHRGKTAPCTDAIIAAKLAKVFVATIDPSKHINGEGIEQLQKAGIEVQTGVCETEAKILNAPFIKFAATGKCWVTLKWAQSIDGKLVYAGKNNQRWISNEQSRKDAHKLRRRAGGILVGIETVLADDPLLTARPSRGKKPTRIVLDSNLRIPLNCKLLVTAKKTPVLIVTSEKSVRTNPLVAEKITQKGAELLAVPVEQNKCDINFLMDELSKRSIAQLLVEGGPTVITSFLKQRLADEIVVYIAPKILGQQGSVSISEPMAELTEAVGLHYVDIKRFGDDVRIAGLSEKVISEMSIVKG